MLEAVMLAEAKDHGNWELLAQTGGRRWPQATCAPSSRPSTERGARPRGGALRAGPRDTRAEMLFGAGHRRRRPAGASSGQRSTSRR